MHTCALAAVLLLLLAAAPSPSSSASSPPGRRVNFYLGGNGDSTANVAFVLANNASLTGAYLCCNVFDFLANGSFVGASDAQARALLEPLSPPSLPLSPALELFFVVGVSNASIASGSWRASVQQAADTAARVGVRGFVVDYEPTSNYSVAHAEAYAAFLSALAEALHGKGLALGADVADWSILDMWGVYVPTPVDFFTSMTPTYYGSDVTRDEAFLLQELAGGVEASRIGVGIGTMLAPGSTPEWNYSWTQPRLSSFLDWVGAQGISRVDFWRADIDHYKVTADWVLAEAARFLAGGG